MVRSLQNDRARSGRDRERKTHGQGRPRVNIDQNQSLSFRFNVRAIPTLLFFKNGQVVDQVTGMTSKKDLLGRLEAIA